MEALDWVAIACWSCVLAISYGVFSVLFQKHLEFKEKTKNQLAFCLVFLCLAIGRNLLIYFDYFLTELDVGRYADFQILWRFANLFEIVGLGFLILVSEYAVFKGKDYYLFFIGFSIVVVIGMFFIQDFFLAQSVSVAAVGFGAFIPISYVYMAIKLPMARRNVIFMLIGFLIFGAGLILMSAGIVDLLGTGNIHIIYLLSAIIQIPGMFILAVAIKRMYFTEKV
jgi:hypothetical protein